MSYGVDQYTQDCLADYGYTPDLDALRPDPELESLAATPEGLDWEPLDNAYLVGRECWQALEDERARKASEAAWAARRKVA
jgi:hypothetical protein